jgi:phosphopantetheine--protein transferase-like protein
VRVRSIDERSVVGDLSLAQDGRVWATIEGWEKRRVETDDRLWSVIRFPEKNVLSEVTGEGFALFEDRYRAGATRERIARRFLGEAERAEYERQTPRRQRSWLAGRIAAKDAVRTLLWRLGHGPLFPVEIAIANEPSGRPVVRTSTGRNLRVSIAHKGNVAVAMACEQRPVGIDIERIETRGESFAELSFTEDELRLVKDEPRDEAWTRLWSAKEAAAKACGTGLVGSPVRFPVRDRVGERLLVGDAWVTTKRHGDFIIGWTQA